MQDAEVWVDLRTPADHAAALAAGLTWAEGKEGVAHRLMGTPEQAEAAGLPWHSVANVMADDWLPTPEDVAERLGALVGSDATLVHIGQGLSGEPILALRIGRGTRALRLLGGHHGNEGSSVELALAVAEALVSGRAALPPDTELWVVPAVNPDGLRANTRANGAGVDLNRNYGWEWVFGPAQNGPGPFSEPESRAIRALARARAFDAGLSLHSGAQNLGWVWNWTAAERAAEEPLLVDLAEAYADGCRAPGFWITNGADWYATRGDTTDWTYGAWGAYDFTLELTADKSPPTSEVAVYTSWHLDAILGWLTRPPDRRAFVVDDVTGERIPARVTSPDTLPLWSPDGTFARWADGDTTWTADAPGYLPTPLVADTSAETRLVSSSLLSTLPSPRLLSRGGGPTALTLPGVHTGSLTLVQPGEADVLLAADAGKPGGGEVTWTVDPTALAPGAWTLVTDAGVVPRGLFVGEVDDRVFIEAAALSDGVLTLTGAGFAPGAEAWSYGGGPARAPHALPRLSEGEDTLVFALLSADDDVLVWTNGAWLAAVDVQGDPTVDTTPPAEVLPEETVVARLDTTITAVGACSSATGSPGALLLLAVPLVAGRRGRRAVPRR